jgi:hypothetical protein
MKAADYREALTELKDQFRLPPNEVLGFVLLIEILETLQQQQASTAGEMIPPIVVKKKGRPKKAA